MVDYRRPTTASSSDGPESLATLHWQHIPTLFFWSHQSHGSRCCLWPWLGVALGEAAPILTDNLEAFNEGMGYNSDLKAGAAYLCRLYSRPSPASFSCQEDQLIWHNLIVDSTMETKADLMRLGGLEMFKVEVIDYHLRVTTDGNQTWCVLYVVETLRKVAFFRLRVRLWETNEQCLERLMLAIKPIIVKCHKGFGHCSFWKSELQRAWRWFLFFRSSKKTTTWPWNIPQTLARLFMNGTFVISGFLGHLEYVPFGVCWKFLR